MEYERRVIEWQRDTGISGGAVRLEDSGGASSCVAARSTRPSCVSPPAELP
jgi:hypothetical protein